MSITVDKLAEKINISGEVRLHESMHLHTSFRIGGPADIYTLPADEDDLGRLLSTAREEEFPLQIIGGGANLLVADAGIRGLVVDLSSLSEIRVDGQGLYAEAGASISSASEAAAEAGLTGLEFIYKMPGSTGGAVWMNARCYGVSISELLRWIDYIDFRGERGRIELPHPDFAYKKSPFQGSDKIIYGAAFALRSGAIEHIRREMDRVYEDRRKKGHFAYPSAGSVFKNDRSLGKPTGVILDELGLKGIERGGAQIAPFHANIIINRGNAAAEDVRYLMELAKGEAKQRLGVELEPEIRLIGDWREER